MLDNRLTGGGEEIAVIPCFEFSCEIQRNRCSTLRLSVSCVGSRLRGGRDTVWWVMRENWEHSAHNPFQRVKDGAAFQWLIAAPIGVYHDERLQQSAHKAITSSTWRREGSVPKTKIYRTTGGSVCQTGFAFRARAGSRTTKREQHRSA